jgi:excisionase family DNA binding protein
MTGEYTAPAPPLLLRPAEAARRLGISRTKVYDLMKAGRLRKVDLGPRCTRIPASALDDLVA